jgi:hypothetical protein
MPNTNLPINTNRDSASPTKLFFDTYGKEPFEFNAVDVDATAAFFQGRGFENDAAIVVTATLLKQAKLDNIPIFQVLDSLKGFNNLELSTLVGEILNNNRVPTSTLGFRTTPVKPNQTRNIAA